MMDFMRRHKQKILWIALVGFFLGVFVSFGSYFFGGRTPGDAVAVVNGHKIPYRSYANLYNRVIDNARRNSKAEITNEMLNQLKQEILQQLIQEEVFAEQAKKFGITVSDTELASDIQNYPNFQKNGKFDQNAYFYILGQVLHMTPAEFEESRRKQIAMFKVRQLIASTVIVPETEVKSEYARMHQGDMKDFDKDHDKFAQELRQQKAMMVLSQWVKQLNQSTKIKIYLPEIEKGA